MKASTCPTFYETILVTYDWVSLTVLYNVLNGNVVVFTAKQRNQNKTNSRKKTNRLSVTMRNKTNQLSVTMININITFQNECHNEGGADLLIWSTFGETFMNFRTDLNWHRGMRRALTEGGGLITTPTNLCSESTKHSSVAAQCTQGFCVAQMLC